MTSRDHSGGGVTRWGGGRRPRRLAPLGTAALIAVSWAGLMTAAPPAGASSGPAARPAPVTPADLSLTTPTGGRHGFRHGAVPRIKSRRGPLRRFVAPRAPATHGSKKELSYGGGLTAGGLVGAGVTTGAPRVYLVFMGSQWGAAGTNGSGQVTFTGDPDGEAAALQTLYGGLGTGGELWSGTVTQYCDGVAVGATACSSAAESIPYPTGAVLAGVFYDNSAIATALSSSGATGHQLALEAEGAAAHFGNLSQAANRDAQYVLASPTGTNPDGWNDPLTGYCAYHDDTHDPAIDGGGPVAGPVLAFTNLPYVPDAGAACGAGSVNNPGVLDGATEAASHEYAETLTDQFPESNPPGGWSDPGGQEIADLCAYISAPAPGAAYNLALASGTVAVQGLWSNQANGGAGGCVQAGPVDHFLPTITSISPASAAVGQGVTIDGTNLSGATRVAFHGVNAVVSSDGPSSMVALVPPGVTDGPVTVTTPSGTATSLQTFTVAAPTIARFTAGAVGQGVVITGSNLSGATRVAFDGVPAVVFADSISSVVAIVPAGTSPGPITVQTPGGTAASAKAFAPVPVVTSVTPASGGVGALVTVAGSGLAGARKVTFGNRKAVVVSDSPSAVVVAVPRRAVSGPVTVVTRGGSASGPSAFTVT
jgi:hypothetical protein